MIAPSNPALAARIERTLQAGFTALDGDGLRVGLAYFETAYRLAEATGDVRQQFLTGRHYFFYLAGAHLPDAAAGLLDMAALYTTAIAPPLTAADRAEFQPLYHELEGRIGILHFDTGQYGAALSWLERSRAGLVTTAPDLPTGTPNYLAQVYCALARYDEAADLLRPSVARAIADPATLYDRALLGKVYLDSGLPDEAGALLAATWQQAETLDVSWCWGLIGNYYAEYLLVTGDPAAALALADRVSERSQIDGWGRSLCMACLIAARAQLALGQSEAARIAVEQAVQLWEKPGGLPAIRAEEVYFYAAVIAAADGRSPASALGHAVTHLAAKLATLTAADAAHLRAHPLSQRIFAAVSHGL